eukprot:4480039-Pyramimonas_sp.AAC.1
MNDYRERGRLIKHLKQVPSCTIPWKEALQHTQPTQEELDHDGTHKAQARNRAQGRCDDYAQRPPIKVFGPPLRMKTKDRRKSQTAYLGAEPPQGE